MTTSFQIDFHFSQAQFEEATPCQDRNQGVDYFLAGIPMAYRKRRHSVGQYNDLALRFSRETGSRTEYDKLLDGSCLARLFVFEFNDCWVLCMASDLIQCLRSKRYVVQRGKNGEMACIDLRDVAHFLIDKEGVHTSSEPETGTTQDSKTDRRSAKNEW